jgi:hypothetical protein
MEASPSWEAASAVAQKIPNILWKLKIYCRAHKSPPLVPILSQINPTNTTPSSSSQTRNCPTQISYIHVPNLMSIFLSLGHLSKESILGPLWHFVTSFIFYCKHVLGVILTLNQQVGGLSIVSCLWPLIHYTQSFSPYPVVAVSIHNRRTRRAMLRGDPLNTEIYICNVHNLRVIRKS